MFIVNSLFHFFHLLSTDQFGVKMRRTVLYFLILFSPVPHSSCQYFGAKQKKIVHYLITYLAIKKLVIAILKPIKYLFDIFP